MTDLQLELAERAKALCEIPSVYGSEQALADKVEAWARGLGAAWPLQRLGNALIVGQAYTDRPLVALVGHLDTVPGKLQDNPPRIEGERLYGLGATDMKGALAVIQRLCETLDPEATPLAPLAIFYDREEGPHEASGLQPLLDQVDAMNRIGLAIVMEPTDGSVQVGCLGSIHAQLVFEGKAAHSARPWQGVNAITQAGAFLARLHEMQPVEVEVGGHRFTEVFTVTTARGGLYRNVVPERFELNLNYRFAPGVSLQEAQRRVLAEVAGQAKVEFTDLAPSGHVPESNALYDRLIAPPASRPALRIAPKIAWTDVARLSNAGIDAVNYGPGQGDQAHQRGEWCPIPALAEAYRTLHSYFTRDP